MPLLPSYRNQSTDLYSKSIDWFLYEATLAFNGLIVIINHDDKVVLSKMYLLSSEN